MHVENLKLYNFRNLSNCTVDLSPRLNLIVGRNGQGKTNLIEALHLLATGKSFRTAELRDLIRWGYSEASAFTDVIRESSYLEQIGPCSLGVIVRKQGREAVVDGRATKSLAGFLGNLVALTFSPFDLNLVRGAPLQRRMFIDRIVIDSRPALLSAYSDAAKANKNKALLLSASDSSPASAELDPWDYILAQAVTKIVPARLEAIELISEYAAQYLSSFAPSDGLLRLSLNTQFRDLDAADAEKVFEHIVSYRAKEMAQSRCLIGPQRDDIKITLGDKEAKSFASQGQVRSIVLSLKAAALRLVEERIKSKPIVILDDFESELDSIRSAALLEIVFRQECQAFITTTEIPREFRQAFSEIPKVMEVAGGEVSEAKF